ncbi:N-acetylneuraminate synthase [uncultured Treponema sp.]|uniref:N-acetylneuraminate synthase n=1 Tax=uncultured Treponema sp. TaxID=162155 RepID=UPI00259600DF|nr:N-acetylneuraminate synthase [uncultured Treponema sp.]
MKKNKTFIIAEAGVNHNGSFELAKKLVDKAVWAGADCIKFQTFNSKNLVSKNAQKAEYQKKTTDSSESQLDMLKKLELSKEEFVELRDYCNQKEIMFLSTPFDLESIDFLASIGVKTWKIPSGEITNYPFLRAIGKRKESVIMSTGMCTLDEVRDTIKVLKDFGTTDITLLHCTTEYPAPYDSVNLNAMLTLQNEFAFKVGYSDHTNGIEIPVAAVAMGATVIEKHFTLDKNMEGPDHKASLEPDELKQMVQSIRNVEAALGDGIKKPSEAEKKNIAIARKSIVAACEIKKGEIFTEENLTAKRPGNGISPMNWAEVLGKIAKRDFSEDELIEL